MTSWIGFGSDVPWWGWMFLVFGLLALVMVFAKLFLPDWFSKDYKVGLDAAPGSKEFVYWASSLLNVPVYRGGTVQLLQNGDEFFPAMLKAIREARDTVNFEVYIFDADEIGRQFIDAFKERARAGVEVRLVLDGIGAIKTKKRHREELCEAGVKIARFRPLSWHSFVRLYRRTHRRAVVIDGEVAFGVCQSLGVLHR